MDIVHRIWPREAPQASLNLSLAERLKQLTEQVQTDTSAKEAETPATPPHTAARPASAPRTTATTVAETDSSPVPEHASASPSSEQQTHKSANAGVADGGSTDAKEAVPAENRPETPAPEQSTAAAEQPSAVEVAMRAEIPTPDPAVNSPAAPADSADAKSDAARRFFRAPKWGSKPEKQGNGGHAKETGQVPGSSGANGQEAAPIAPAPPSETPTPPSPPKADAAPNSAEPAGENTLASVRRELAELQTARQEFETEIRNRLDVAIADYERRLSSETLASEAAGQFEGRTKQATDKIFREVKEQAWTMLNAVAGELRAFRDQFGKEIQERSGNLEETARQAMQVKEKLEETLPIAEEILHSLPLAGQEAAAQVQAATAAITDQLNSSHQALSLEIENQKNSFKSLLQDCHQDEMRLKEEVEKFRAEVVAASELPGRMADESLERLRAGADEVDVRLRSGLESLAGQIEHHLLSPELVDKATAQIETATQQQVIEPALERIRSASAEAGTAADSLQHASRDVTDRLGAARQQIETRLEALMSEQQSLLESSMNGLHRKAAEELGNVVEHVVAQSSQQLDDRLHALFDDLLSSTSEKINGVARVTLNTLHDGLKDVFEPEAAAEVADPATVPGES